MLKPNPENTVCNFANGNAAILILYYYLVNKKYKMLINIFF